MRRRIALAGLGAVVLGAGSAAIAQPDARGGDTRAWLQSLDATGWIRSSLSADERTITFRKPPEPRPEGTMSMWERFERRDEPRGQWRSLVALSEFDCRERRARTLQETTYSEPNLSGNPVTATAPSEWTYPIPGSMMEGSMRLACEPTKASRARAATAAGTTRAAPPPANAPPTAKKAPAKKKPPAKKPPRTVTRIMPPESPPM